MTSRPILAGVVFAVLATVAACSSDSGGPTSPSGSTSNLGGSGSSGSGTSGAGTSGTGLAGTGLLGGSGATNGSLASADIAGTGASVGTNGVSTSGLAGTNGVGTNGLLNTNGVSVVPNATAATGTGTTSGTPLLNGALVSTDGTGSGTTGLLTTNTTTPNGTSNTAALNAPAPALGDTSVLPNGANGGSAVTLGTGSTSTSTNSGLLNGVLSTTGVTR